MDCKYQLRDTDNWKVRDKLTGEVGKVIGFTKLNHFCHVIWPEKNEGLLRSPYNGYEFIKKQEERNGCEGDYNI